MKVKTPVKSRPAKGVDARKAISSGRNTVVIARPVSKKNDVKKAPAAKPSGSTVKPSPKALSNSSTLRTAKKSRMAEQELLNNYTEDSIRSLDWREHIRLRPGMYI